METKPIKSPDEKLRDDRFDGLRQEAAISDFTPGKPSLRSQVIMTFKLLGSVVLLGGLLWALDQYVAG